MSAEIIDTTDGILTIKMTGKLTHPQFAALQCRATEIIKNHQPIKILVLTEDFQGWEKQGDWGDLSFQFENDQYIEKMAIVGDKKWQDLATMFVGKGYRKFPIEYFPPEASDKAREWILNR